MLTFENSPWFARLLVDDALLPSQLARRETEPPYCALLRAVLVTTIQDLHRGGQLRRDAVAWLDGAQAPFNFITVCQALDLQPELTRRAMLSSSHRVAIPRRERGPGRVKVAISS